MVNAHDIEDAKFDRAEPNAVGYDEWAVDAFLDRVAATLKAIDSDQPTPSDAVNSTIVVDTDFPERGVDMDGGYDRDQVDDLLDLVAQRLFAYENETGNTAPPLGGARDWEATGEQEQRDDYDRVDRDADDDVHGDASAIAAAAGYSRASQAGPHGNRDHGRDELSRDAEGAADGKHERVNEGTHRESHLRPAVLDETHETTSSSRDEDDAPQVAPETAPVYDHTVATGEPSAASIHDAESAPSERGAYAEPAALHDVQPQQAGQHDSLGDQFDDDARSQRGVETTEFHPAETVETSSQPSPTAAQRTPLPGNSQAENTEAADDYHPHYSNYTASAASSESSEQTSQPVSRAENEAAPQAAQPAEGAGRESAGQFVSQDASSAPRDGGPTHDDVSHIGAMRAVQGGASGPGDDAVKRPGSLGGVSSDAANPLTSNTPADSADAPSSVSGVSQGDASSTSDVSQASHPGAEAHAGPHAAQPASPQEQKMPSTPEPQHPETPQRPSSPDQPSGPTAPPSSVPKAEPIDRPTSIDRPETLPKREEKTTKGFFKRLFKG